MNVHTPDRTTESTSGDWRVYPLVAFSVATGIFFFVQYQLEYTPPEGPAIVTLVGLTVGVPFVMGYTGYSFPESTVVGVLPWLGTQVGTWLDPPVGLVSIENMANAFLIGAGVALPVVAIPFVVGVGLRDRDALSRRRRGLAVRLGTAVLIAIVVFTAAQLGYLSAGVDQ